MSEASRSTDETAVVYGSNVEDSSPLHTPDDIEKTLGETGSSSKIDGEGLPMDTESAHVATGGASEGGAQAVLQDQTNLLPMRQLLVVFSGLSAAMFCKAF